MGAQPWAIFRQVLRERLIFVLAGIVLGLLAAWRGTIFQIVLSLCTSPNQLLHHSFPRVFDLAELPAEESIFCRRARAAFLTSGLGSCKSSSTAGLADCTAV